MARLLLFWFVSLHLLVGCGVIARPILEVEEEEEGKEAHNAEAPNHRHSSTWPSIGNEQEVTGSGAPASESREMGHDHEQHRRRGTSDKSIAGAEVMLGGLATAVFVAIFAYIRVTRKRRSSDYKS